MLASLCKTAGKQPRAAAADEEACEARAVKRGSVIIGLKQSGAQALRRSERQRNLEQVARRGRKYFCLVRMENLWYNYR